MISKINESTTVQLFERLFTFFVILGLSDLLMRYSNGSIIVDFVISYAARMSAGEKESVRKALETASGLKGLGAQFKNIGFCGKFLMQQ